MKSVGDNLLRQMTRRLVEQFQPEQIILFGSHAWGTPSPDSDVDLLVIVTQSDLSDYERAVLGHRCLSGLDVPKDVMVKTRAEFDFFRPVRASLEHKIAAQGRVLYERGGKNMNQEILSTEQLRALLKAFKEQHAEEYHLRALGYFGSYARNEATPDSDVDVVFQTDQPDLFITAMLKQDLEALLKHPVDVIRLRDTMNPRLKARIEREATYV